MKVHVRKGSSRLAGACVFAGAGGLRGLSGTELVGGIGSHPSLLNKLLDTLLTLMIIALIRNELSSSQLSRDKFKNDLYGEI